MHQSEAPNYVLPTFDSLLLEEIPPFTGELLIAMLTENGVSERTRRDVPLKLG